MSVTLSAVGGSTALQFLHAANDNSSALGGVEVAHPALLREALRLLAAHGAGAPDQARDHAQRAFFAGRRRDYLHWLAIGRALDRHLVEG